MGEAFTRAVQFLDSTGGVWSESVKIVDRSRC